MCIRDRYSAPLDRHGSLMVLHFFSSFLLFPDILILLLLLMFYLVSTLLFLSLIHISPSITPEISPTVSTAVTTNIISTGKIALKSNTGLTGIKSGNANQLASATLLQSNTHDFTNSVPSPLIPVVRCV